MARIRTQKLEFDGHGGHRLAARLDLPEGRPRATALFAHCFTCSKDIFAASRIAGALAERGIAVLRFDFTGSAPATASSPTPTSPPTSPTWSRPPTTCAESHEAPPQILIGHSLGGAAVLAAAGDIPQVRAVVTIAAPADAAHVVENFRRRPRAHRARRHRRGHPRRPQLHDPPRVPRRPRGEPGRGAGGGAEEAPAGLPRPRDMTVGIDNATRIFRAAKHPKSFVSLDGADHLLTRHADATYVAEVLAAWASRYVAEAEPAAVADEEPAAGVEVVETGEGAFQLRAPSARTACWSTSRRSAAAAPDPTPYGYLAIALAGCTAMTLRMYAGTRAPAWGGSRSTSPTARSTPRTAPIAARAAKAGSTVSSG
jgi:alpha-beta hydrolase superfamily lysophospholipase